MTNELMVSVKMITYNHEHFINQAIEGILMQETYFKFELIIADDCSTDRTQEIVNNLILTHPKGNLINYFRHEKNIGIQENGLFALDQCKGKYIAFCEGDDYWTDPFKLQKQVIFLENNSDYGLVHSDCDEKDANSKNIVKSINKKNNFNLSNIEDKNILFNAIIDGTYVLRTATVVLRKSCFLDISKKMKLLKNKFLMGDTPIWLYLSMITKFYYFDEVFAVYNLSMNSVTRPGNKLKELRFSLSICEVRIWFINEFDFTITETLKSRYNKSLLRYKLYDFKYDEMFPLIKPSSLERFLWNFIKYNSVRFVLRSLVSFGILRNIYKKGEIVFK